MEILFAVGIILIGVLVYTTINLLYKVEKLEDVNEKQSLVLAAYLEHINIFSKMIDHSAKKLVELDNKGSFKSDDEIGWFFDEIIKIQIRLNQFSVSNINIVGDDGAKEKKTEK